MNIINYTRTGTANRVTVGNISFDSNYTAVTLQNVFPVAKSSIGSDTDNVLTVTVNVTGNTSYQGGIDYKVTATNVNIETNNISVPIGVNVSQEDLNLSGNEITLYSYEDGAVLEENGELAVGHIKTGNDTNGNITIRVYLDEAYVAITDTLEDGAIAVENTTNGTTSTWVNNRVVLTTAEWNALQANGLSFKVKVEATLGEDVTNKNVIIYNKNGVKGTTPKRQVLTGSNDVILEKVKVPGFKGWAETANAEEAVYQLGDVVSFNTNKTLYAVWGEPTTAELLTFDYDDRTACMQKVANDGPYGSGDIVYYMDNDETCLKNYVWYSGKLWRITAIYPDGKMKLVTENPMTAIMPSNASWNSSHIKTWLNTEFLPTLYNKENIIVENAEWNIKQTSTATTNPYPTTNANDIVTGAIGLLNAYEWTKSYTSSGSNSYLHIGQYWWLMNSKSSSIVWYVSNNGYADSYGVSGAYGLRPSIYLQSNVAFASGEGTRNNPYMIKGDKNVASSNDNLTRRTNGINGEYVKFNNEVYRIIGLEGTTTKIVKADYIRDGNTVVTKKLSSDVYYDTASANNTYGDYYLVNDWYNNIATSPINYKGMIATNTDPEAQGELAGKYYKKIFTGGSYQDVLSDNASEYYYSKVGLLRYGEMFASHLSLGTHINNSSSYSNMWLLTPNNSSSNVWYVGNRGIAYNRGVSNTNGLRPSINLISSVRVTCNSGEMGTACDGTYFRPYDLTM